ncbi:hypothetical protein MASR2M47_35910 [Draconibacterium sp.]|jgi:hypothetical protein
MAKIPMVIPNNDRNVRSLFALSELKANVKLSSINLIRSIFRISKFVSKVKICFLILYKTTFFLLALTQCMGVGHLKILFNNPLFQSEFINKELFETSVFSINSTLIFLSLRPKIEKGING